MLNDEDFEIDPRLGGSKIKQSIKTTKKDKLRKSTDQDFKKVKSSIEQRSPYVHVEGNWSVLLSLCQVCMICNIYCYEIV